MHYNDEQTLTLRKPFTPNPDRLQVLSNGGGTQSCAVAVLIYQGALPKPDLVIMVDTEREASDAIEYQLKHIKPLFDEMGVPFLVVKKSKWTRDDVVSENDDDCVLPGFYTEFSGRDKHGKCNKQPGYCSSKWKVTPLRRELNHRFGEKELTAQGVDFWVGMSLEERSRVKYPTGKWQKRYPLFEAGILRNQAIKIVEDFGLPTPPRSSCWMCPNRANEEWLFMQQHVPQDFAAAVAFEKELRKDFPWLYLHKEGKTLDLVDLTIPTKQLDIYDQFCDTGMCFV